MRRVSQGVMPSSAALVLFVAIAATAHSSCVAQPIEAATDPRQAPPSFKLQGEYVGLVSGGYRRQTFGLQVVAMGDGELQAVEYRGGLPGAGWDGQMSEPTPGVFTASVASLANDRRKIGILGGRLWFRDGDGVLRGLMKKVHRQSPTMSAPPAPGALVLFDGTSTDQFERGARMTEDGLLKEGALTKRAFGDFFMHLEFRTPFMPAARGQGRGNSGVYIQQRYEVQILDSFGLEGVANECGGVYKAQAPRVNMCFPPLTWQTYDIDFRAARFNTAGEKTENARITVRQNGVTIHEDYELENKTGAGRQEGPEARPILFQNHHDPVRYRNIWIVDRRSSSTPSRPRSLEPSRCFAGITVPIAPVSLAEQFKGSNL